MKVILKWLIVGTTLVFVLNAFRTHWQDVIALEITRSHLNYSAIALVVTLMAHLWSGLVWAGILRFLKQPAPLIWILTIYLQTNLAKYLPGNIWHFYGRIRAMQQAGVSLEAATFSTLLEPLLMATAAILIAIAATPQGWLLPVNSPFQQWLPFLFASAILIGIHPHCFNRLIKGIARFKFSSQQPSLTLQAYPWQLLLGEIGFVSLRGSGFILTVAGFTPVSPSDIPLLLGGFSLAWFLGLVIPAPGGIGVFESSAIALLDDTLTPAILLSSTALFRLLSLMAEILAAALFWKRR